MCNITIVDAPCGYGKTSWAIEYMNKNIFERFIYITPFLQEIERVKETATNRIFIAPNNSNKKGSKREHFYNLIKDGNDIISTHSLFKGVNKEVKNTIREMEYILILDEVMDVVEQINITSDDISILLEQKIITVDSNDKVHWNDEDYDGDFRRIYEPIKNGDVYLHNKSMILWTFPSEIFKSFKEVYILTYMFKGQVQKYYYDMNSVKYKYASVKKVNLSKEDYQYELCDYEYINGNQYKNLIHIYEGNLNDIGNGEFSLSKTWYDKANKKAPMNKLKDNVYNYFKNVIKGKSNDNMWTTFKDYKNQYSGKGYTKGFVVLTARATNEYKHKTNCAYLVNRYYLPMIEQFFISKGVAIDKDIWALSELIQWLFRSAIRENKEINLYIPSERMRKLLKKWLEI